MPTATNNSLARQIAADPNNADAYLVLADELLAKGDRHGELIVMQKERKRAQRSAELLAELGPHLFGELWPIAKRRRRKGEGRPPIHAEWFMGHIKSVRLDCVDEETQLETMIPALLDRPAARFLQHLSLAGVAAAHTNHDYGTAIEILAEIDPPATLKSLFFGDFVEEDWQESWNTIRNFDLLSKRFPKLEALRIFSAGPSLATPIDLDALALPQLRLLQIETDYTESTKLVERIVDGPNKKLEHLAISFGVNVHDEPKLRDFQPVLAGKRLTSLTSLSLDWIDFGPQFVEAIVKSKLGARLTHLGLRSAHLHDEHVDRLLAAHLPALRSIDLSQNFITKPAQKRAKRIAKTVELGLQWPPREDYLR